MANKFSFTSFVVYIPLILSFLVGSSITAVSQELSDHEKMVQDILDSNQLHDLLMNIVDARLKEQSESNFPAIRGKAQGEENIELNTAEGSSVELANMKQKVLSAIEAEVFFNIPVETNKISTPLPLEVLTVGEISNLDDGKQGLKELAVTISKDMLVDPEPLTAELRHQNAVLSEQDQNQPTYTVNIVQSIDMVLVLINTKKSESKVIGVGALYPEGISPNAAIQRNLADIFVGSGFASSFYPLSPLGWMKTDGVTIQKPIIEDPRYRRLVSISKGKLRISGIDEFIDTIDVKAGIQVGPGLIEDTKIGISDQEPIIQVGKAAIRTFIGVCGDSTLLGYTMSPSHLYPIAEYIMEHYDCTELTNLSGGSEAFLAYRDPKNESEFVLYGNTKTARASMVGFTIIHK